ncbi:hypothetical protein JCM19236_5857 [Vibrio sp. JCM 19236]|nr:hypothetical protein JCM19236_5857 [Vibrio sp. JCM 19236]
MFIKKYVMLLTTICIFTASNAHALAVSSIFEVADEQGSGELKMINNDGKDMFVRLTMSKVTYEKGIKKFTPLNRDNMNSWHLSITPPQLIMKDGERKAVGIKYTCEPKEGDSCNLNEDQIYSIDIAPVPYSESKRDSAAIAFGYKLYFLVPAKKVNLKYSIKRVDAEHFVFSNNSNTMLNAVINTCTKKYSDSCILEYRLLPGVEKNIVYQNHLCIRIRLMSL